MVKKHTHTRLITKHHFFPKFIHKKKPQSHVRYEPTLKLKLNTDYEDTDTAGSWNYDSNPWESKSNQHFAPGKKNIDWSLMKAAYESNYDDVEIPNFSHKIKKPEYEPHYSEGDYPELKFNSYHNKRPKNKYKMTSDYHHQGDVFAPMPSSEYNHFHGYMNEKQFQDEEDEEADGSDRKIYIQPNQFQEQQPSYMKLTSNDHIDSPITYNQWPNSQAEDSYQNWGGGGSNTAGIDSYRTLPNVDEMDEILKYENYERSLKKLNNNESNVYKIFKNKIKPKSQRHTTIISQSY